MFRFAEDGEEVWHFKYGKGFIVNNHYNTSEKEVMFPIYAEFERGSGFFTVDGKEDKDDLNPSLFWRKVKIVTHEESLDLESEYKKLNRTPFIRGAENYFFYFSHNTGKWEFSNHTSVECPTMTYFENPMIILSFVNMLNYKKISPMRVNEIIRKVCV